LEAPSTGDAEVDKQWLYGDAMVAIVAGRYSTIINISLMADAMKHKERCH